MMTLVLGATGATGRLLVQRLVDRGSRVRALVREADRLPAHLRNSDRVEVVVTALGDLDAGAWKEQVKGCGAVASCLGHRATVRGMWGPPYGLVTQAAQRVIAAIRSLPPQQQVRLVWMSTVAVCDARVDPRRPLRDRITFGLLHLLLPPQRDNERAAAALQAFGGRDARPAWCAVRPCSLVDGSVVTPYSMEPKLLHSPLFERAQASRINVADAMAGLCLGGDLWTRWMGRMPVLQDSLAPGATIG